MNKVYIEHRDVDYPDKNYLYAPSTKYPEYMWDDISPEINEVYDMVRSCLIGYGLDKNNYGTSKWNPLGDVIKPHDVVVIKPNWVEHENENKNGGLDCLVTNASVIRAVIDYVYIAIGNTGKIIIGDSPMPDCKINELMVKAGYNEIWESCKKRNINISVIDFREDITVGLGNEVVDTDGDSEVIVDLLDDSYFKDVEDKVGRFRNGILDATKMNEFYHVVGHHRYGINRTVLEADVIINLPKPKTHRKAGYTAALKNYIGVCSRKISIPHNVTGNTCEGGDTYYGPKIIFGTESKLRDIENKYIANKKLVRGYICKAFRVPFWIFRRLTHRKYYGTGNWHKNDTIWRAILDINKIMLFCNKKGEMTREPQRKFFSLGDMIVAGEKNGPLSPSYKKVGMIICSENPILFDEAVVKIMNFSLDKIPLFVNLNKEDDFVVYYSDGIGVLFSNEVDNNGINISEKKYIGNNYFEPAEGWDNIRI